MAMAAVRTGISGMELVPEDGDPEDGDVVTNVARIATLSLEDPAARGHELLRLAIEQAVPPLLGRAIGPLGVWTVGPAMLDTRHAAAQVLAENHRIVPAIVEAVGDHGSAALLAAERAARRLLAGEIELALIVGFDVRTDEKAVAKAAADGRAIGPGRSWGYVPGEAAAAVLLASERGLQRLAVPSQSTLVAVSSATEPNPPDAAVPCVGRGVTEAVRKVLAALPVDGRIACVLCDLNGERARTDEWGFTLPRVVRQLSDPGAFVAPASAWGDCGAANGLLLLALAVAINKREKATGSHALIWTSSDGRERAAALVRTADPAGGKRPEGKSMAQNAPPVSPPWAEQLDREVLANMAEECCFRYQQRGSQLAELANGEAAENWRHIERTEECADNLALGLGECGPLAREVVKSASSSGEPGTVYTAVRTFLEAGERRQAIGIAQQQIAADPSLESAVLAAFQQAIRSTGTPQDIVSELLAAEPVPSWLALEVAISVGVRIPLAKLHQLADNVSQERVLFFVSALGRSGDPGARAILSRWQNSPDASIRQETALADVLLAPTDAKMRILQNVPYDDAVLLPAALVVDTPQSPPLFARAKVAKGPDPILAMAIAGDHMAVPWLLERIQDEGTAGMAACALEILLGPSLFEAYDLPDEDSSAAPRKARRVSRNRADWAAVAERVLVHHPRDLRLRAGAPATATATITLLNRPHLPFIARRYLGCELSVRWKISPIFNPTAVMRVQREQLLAAERAARPGSRNA